MQHQLLQQAEQLYSEGLYRRAFAAYAEIHANCVDVQWDRQIDSSDIRDVYAANGLIAAGSHGGRIHLLDYNGEYVWNEPYQTPGRVISVTIAQQGETSWILGCDEDGILHIINGDKSSCRQVEFEGGLHCIRMLPDSNGTKAVLTQLAPGCIYIVEIPSGKIIKEYPTDQQTRKISIFQDVVYVVSLEGSLYKLTDEEKLEKVDLGRGPLFSVVVDDIDEDGIAEILVATGSVYAYAVHEDEDQEVWRHSGKNIVYDIAVCNISGGKEVALASRDGRIYWYTGAGRSKGHTNLGMEVWAISAMSDNGSSMPGSKNRLRLVASTGGGQVFCLERVEHIWDRLSECYELMRKDYPSARALLEALRDDENQYARGLAPRFALDNLSFADFSSIFRAMLPDESIHVQSQLVDTLINTGTRGYVHQVIPLFRELNPEHAKRLADQIVKGMRFIAENNPLLSGQIFAELANLQAKFRKVEQRNRYAHGLDLFYSGEYKEARQIFEEILDLDVDMVCDADLNDVVTSLHSDNSDESVLVNTVGANLYKLRSDGLISWTHSDFTDSEHQLCAIRRAAIAVRQHSLGYSDILIGTLKGELFYLDIDEKMHKILSGREPIYAVDAREGKNSKMVVLGFIGKRVELYRYPPGYASSTGTRVWGKRCQNVPWCVKIGSLQQEMLNVVVGEEQGYIQIFDSTDGREIYSAQCDDTIASLQLHDLDSDGVEEAIACSKSGTVYILDHVDGEYNLKEVENPDSEDIKYFTAFPFVALDEEHYVAACTRDGIVNVYDKDGVFRREYDLEMAIDVCAPVYSGEAVNLSVGHESSVSLVKLLDPEQILEKIEECDDRIKQTGQEFVRIDDPYVYLRALNWADYLVERGIIFSEITKGFVANDEKKLLLLAGPAKAGASTLLNQVVRHAESSGHIAIYVDIEELNTSSYAQLLQGIVVRSQRSTIYKRISSTILLDRFHRDPFRYFRDFMKELELGLEREKKRALIIMDHFEPVAISDRCGTYVVEYLLERAREASRIQFIYCGRRMDFQDPTQENAIAQMSDMVIKNNVPYLTDEEAEDLIRDPVDGTVSYTEDVLERIWTLTGRHPFLIQALCSTLIRQMNAEKVSVPSLSSVDEAARKVIDIKAVSNVFEELWSSLTGEARIILAVMAGRLRGQVLRRYSFEQQFAMLEYILPAETWQATVDMLVEREILHPLGPDSYKLTFELFADWIVARYPWYYEVILTNISLTEEEIPLSAIPESDEQLRREGALEHFVRFLGMSGDEWERILSICRGWVGLKAGQSSREEITETAKQLLRDLLQQVELKEGAEAIHDSIATRRISATFLNRAQKDCILVFLLNPKPSPDDAVYIFRAIENEEGTELSLLLLLNGSEELENKLKGHSSDIIVLKEPELRSLIFTPRPHESLIDIIWDQRDLAVINPYQTEGPVTGDRFFDRKREMRILRRYENVNHMVIGGRRLGKTSLLMKLEAEYSELPDNDIVLMDCTPYEDERSFISALSGRISEVSSERISRNVGTVKTIKEHIRRIYRKDGPKQLILLLDEVDRILKWDIEQNDKRLFYALRGVPNEARCSITVAGYRMLFLMTKDESSPFFNFGERVYLENLDRADALELIERPMEDIGLQYGSPDLPEDILRYTAGHPNFIQIFCHELVRKIGKQERVITSEHIQEIAESAEFAEGIVTVPFFYNLTNLEKLIVLRFMAGDMFAREYVFKELSVLGLGDIEEVYIHEALDILRVQSVLYKQGKYYGFTYPLYKEALERVEDVAALEKRCIEYLKLYGVSGEPLGHLIRR